MSSNETGQVNEVGRFYKLTPMLSIAATSETLEVYNEMKLGKQIAFLIFKITSPDIVLETKVLKSDLELNAEEEKDDKDDKDDHYCNEFIRTIKESGEPRYGIIDYNNKLLFVFWVPDTSKANDRLTYAASKEKFSQELIGIQISLQATDDNELSPKIIQEKTKSNV